MSITHIRADSTHQVPISLYSCADRVARDLEKEATMATVMENGSKVGCMQGFGCFI